MSEPEEIFARCSVILGKAGALSGKQVLVSAGGTREPLDAVRYVGNRSSGRMGVALAEGGAAARRRGDAAGRESRGAAAVGRDRRRDRDRSRARGGDVRAPGIGRRVDGGRGRRLPPADAIAGKRSKDGDGWSVELEPTQDVLAELGRRRANGQVLVGLRPTTARRVSTVRARSSPRRRSTSSSSMTSRATTSASTPRRTGGDDLCRRRRARRDEGS